MVYVFPLVLIILIALIVLYARNMNAYYTKIYSDAHYTEIGNWLIAALKVGPTNESDFDDRTALLTSAKCALSFTRSLDEEDEIHIAFSQVRGVTTHGASNRIIFFVLQMLKENNARADFFYTESTVHHAVFTKDAGGEWLTRPVADALTDMARYEPIPFQFKSMKEAEKLLKDLPM